MKTRIINLLIGLALAAAIYRIPTQPPAPKETVTNYGPNFRLIKRPEARGAERWIFQRMVGTNDQVIMEAIVEGGQIKAAMQGASFSWGDCGTRAFESEYFQGGHLGMMPICRVDLTTEPPTVSDIPTSQSNAEVFIKKTAAVGGAFAYTFYCPTSAKGIEDLFANMATNNSPLIILIPVNRWRGPFTEVRTVPLDPVAVPTR